MTDEGYLKPLKVWVITSEHEGCGCSLQNPRPNLLDPSSSSSKKKANPRPNTIFAQQEPFAISYMRYPSENEQQKFEQKRPSKRDLFFF